MGGQGSGRRWRHGAKGVTDDYLVLDIRRLQKAGLLASDQAFSWQWTSDGQMVAFIHVRTESDRVILAYRHRFRDSAWQDEHYPVRLDWSACTYGGQRAWFLCPAQGCGRRVAILYCDGIFACRRCCGLAYPSQRETAIDRAARRADAIRRRLGWQEGILNPSGGKPKGMHWRTFERLRAQHEKFLRVSLAGMARQLGILNERPN